MTIRIPALFVLAGLAAAGGSGVAMVNANAQNAPATPQVSTEQPGGGGPTGGWWHGASAQDREAMLDARIAAFHAGLKLTPDQDKLWGPLEQAVRDGMKARIDEMTKIRTEGPPADPVAGLRRIAEISTLRGQGLTRVAEAAQPLYASLSDDQKQRVTMLAHMFHPGHEGGGHHKGFMGGLMQRFGFMGHHGDHGQKGEMGDMTGAMGNGGDDGEPRDQ
jgi:zinc resistance-associated protein